MYAKVLSTFDGSESDLLMSWDWGVPPENVEYHALFPRSWTTFLEPVPGVNVVIRQVSPIMPNSYSESSFPVSVFHVEVENLNDSVEHISVSIMFTFENGQTNVPNDPNSVPLSEFKESEVEGFLHGGFTIGNDNSNSSNPSIISRGVAMSNHRLSERARRASGTCYCVKDDIFRKCFACLQNKTSQESYKSTYYCDQVR